LAATTRKTASSSTRRARGASGGPRFQAPEPLIEHPRQVDAVTGRLPAKKAPVRPAKATKPAGAKPPGTKPDEAERDPSRPHQHNGVEVVREELRSNLPSGAPYKVSKLHLVDGTVAHACRDCLFTADTSPQVREHRNAEHGTRYGKRPPKVHWEKDPDVGDLVLPLRGDKPAPTNPMEMTLAEFLALAPSYAALSDLIDRTERERDAALDKLAELMASNKEAQHALAVYPALQQEVVDLRLMVRNVGAYEELKNEVLALRVFKKKILSKLEAVGFNFVDEDSKEQ
jgi:hypothetical protein